jgi:hypothetical protein
MRKFLILSSILVLSLTLYWLSESKIEQDQEIFESESKQDKILLDPKLQKKLKQDRKNTLKKILENKHKDISNTKSFVTFTENKPLDTFKDKEFLNKTFHTLLECYKEGCGQGADHDGYYNAAQTVAAVTLNRILKAGLESGELDAKSWMSEDELLGLFSSANERTRDLAFKHLLTRGSTKEQIDKVLTTASDLDGYELGSTIKNIAPYITSEKVAAYVESVTTILQTKDGLGKTELLMNSVDIKISLNQAEQIFEATCKPYREEKYNQKAYIRHTEDWAKASGHSLDLAKHCQ